MRLLRLLLVGAALSAGCGTVTSLEPLSESSDLVFETALLGAWKDDSAKVHLVITPSESNAYLIAMAEEDGKTGRFVGQLTKLNGRLVLDVTPEPLAAQVTDLYRDLMQPLHTFIYLDFVGEQLRVGMPNADSVLYQLKAHPGVLAYTEAGDRLLLTSPTAELRAFFAAFAARPGTVDSVSTWRRP